MTTLCLSRICVSVVETVLLHGIKVFTDKEHFHIIPDRFHQRIATNSNLQWVVYSKSIYKYFIFDGSPKDGWLLIKRIVQL